MTLPEPATIHTYQDAVAAIESFIFPPDGIFRLDRIRQLLSELGDPQTRYPVIHIAGTAGKGSTSYLTAAILEAAGYRVGLHMSPHLVSMTERLIVNGVPVSEEGFVRAVASILPVVAHVARTNAMGTPTYFEILVALALKHFADEHVDVAVVEVGLGGRYDATNVIDSAVSVVTSIGLDHTEFLGDTVEKIVMEKREIIKPHTVTVSGVTQPSVRDLVIGKCRDVASTLHLVDRDFSVDGIVPAPSFSPPSWKAGTTFDYVSKGFTARGLHLNLPGAFQVANAAVAITAATVLPGFTVGEDAVRRSLSAAVFPGRVETVVRDEGRIIILDGAHNPMKMAALIDTFTSLLPGRRVPVVLAVKGDKNLTEMVRQLLPVTSKFILTTFERTTDLGRNVMFPMEALERAIRNADPAIPVLKQPDYPALLSSLHDTAGDDIVLITGSLYLVGKTRELLRLPWIPHL